MPCTSQCGRLLEYVCIRLIAPIRHEVRQHWAASEKFYHQAKHRIRRRISHLRSLSLKAASVIPQVEVSPVGTVQFFHYFWTTSVFDAHPCPSIWSQARFFCKRNKIFPLLCEKNSRWCIVATYNYIIIIKKHFKSLASLVCHNSCLTDKLGQNSWRDFEKTVWQMHGEDLCVYFIDMHLTVSIFVDEVQVQGR